MSTRMALRKWTSPACLSALVGVISIVACKDLTGVPASYSNLSDSATVYSLNGAPLGAPTALYVYGATVLAADASFSFDVAFDITGPREVTILPVRTVASGLVSTHSVGLATVADTFGAVNSVPKGTSFRADTAVTVVPTEVVLVQVDESGSACASSSTGSNIYGKLVIRSIDLDARTMQVEFAVDPNCGFRSFESGVPTFVWRTPVAAVRTLQRR